jgi:GT2 family glycosyltransferase
MNNTVSVVISTREINDEYIKHVSKAFSHPKTEIIVFENSGEYSLPQLYNKALDEAQNDIIVFMHDDLILETTNFTNKIIKMFERNPEYGIIGVAGTTDLVNGKWWDLKESMVGQVSHQKDGKKWTNKYSGTFGTDLKEVVTVDGLLFAVSKSRIKDRFDVEFPGFHFYEVPFCLANHLNGVKVGVTTQLKLTHKSVGETNEQWEENKKLFETKFKDVLPVRLTDNKTFAEKMIIDWDKVGIAMVTYNSEDRIKQSAFTVPDKLKHFYIVNDGTPYSEGCYPENATIIQHETNKGVGGAKNTALQALMDAGCEHLFLMEDDVLIKDPNVFDAYILTSVITNVKHLNFALQGPANMKRKDGFDSLAGGSEPNPRQVIKFPEGIALALYPNCVGAFSYYRREVIETIGMMDPGFKNAWEHVDHTYMAAKKNLTTPFWWFADIADSGNFLDNIENCIEESTIRTSETFSDDFKNSSMHFLKKHKMMPREIPLANPEQINGLIQFLYSSR